MTYGVPAGHRLALVADGSATSASSTLRPAHS